MTRCICGRVYLSYTISISAMYVHVEVFAGTIIAQKPGSNMFADVFAVRLAQGCNANAPIMALARLFYGAQAIHEI